jgi:hypothetical protein
MAQKISHRFLALCLVLMVLAVSAHGQDYKPLLGKWNMTSESTEDPVKWTLTLQASEGKLTGTMSTGEGEQAAKDLTFVDGVLKFQAPYQGSYYDIELKATADKLEGTWDGGGDSGKTYGTRN